MLKRGYIILFVGGALVVAGIVISAASAGSFVGQFMQENTFIDQAIVGPSETINATLQVNDISRPIAIGLHIEPESANVILRETVRDPGGRVINTKNSQKSFLPHLKSIV